EGVLAHVDAVTRGAARQPLLPRRRDDPGLVPDRSDGARREAAESAQQQRALLPRDGPPRADPRPLAAAVLDRAAPALSPALRDAVLDRRLGAVLGDAPLRPRLRRLAGGSRRHAVLAQAPLCADRLLAELPPRPLDGAAVRRLPRRARRPRAGGRGGRGAPVERRRAPAGL